jgi:hypothetical protein
MSALVMALVAGMAVGNGPERVSTGTEQRLCLDGEWAGTLQGWPFSTQGEVRDVSINSNSIWVSTRFEKCSAVCKWVDLGKGKVLVNMSGYILQGTYNREAGRLVICLKEPIVQPGEPSFDAVGGQLLIIIKPAKLPK